MEEDLQDILTKVKSKRKMFNNIESITDEEFKTFFKRTKKMVATVLKNYNIIKKRLGTYEQDKLDEIYAVMFDVMAGIGVNLEDLNIQFIQNSLSQKHIDEYKHYVSPHTSDFTNEKYDAEYRLKFNGTIYVQVIDNPEIEFIESDTSINFYYTSCNVKVRVPPQASKHFNGAFAKMVISESTKDRLENQSRVAKVSKGHIYECLNPICILKNPENKENLRKGVEWEFRCGVSRVTEVEGAVGDRF